MLKISAAKVLSATCLPTHLQGDERTMVKEDCTNRQDKLELHQFTNSMRNAPAIATDTAHRTSEPECARY